ncbi:MAG: hypothetical protein KGI80_02835 [Verrucomicrobiota bacterium]|nr:hypothetical protein [Verrucomicrobiota bacterium]
MPLLFSAAAQDCLKSPLILEMESLSQTPFHFFTCALFLLAIVHTLSVHWIRAWARALEIRQVPRRQGERSAGIQMLYFLSEVEMIFAFWAAPLFFCVVAFYGWEAAFVYINTRDYTEAMFVTVLLAIASTRPLIEFAEKTIRFSARLFGSSLSAWWFVLLTIGPLLGSIITEVGAMILCALLLSKQFYEYRPSWELAYATLGLLFVNISVGGTLTAFGSPAVLILSHAWGWKSIYMILNFGWKAVLSILVSNALYWFFFRKELLSLDARKRELETLRILRPTKVEESSIPHWIATVHLLFIALIVMVSHYPAIFLAFFFFFVAFHQVTRGHQSPIRLTRPILVGLFIAGLTVHVGLQGWWVSKILHSLSPNGVLLASVVMTGFTDNAAIAALGSLVPNWNDFYYYALFTGIIAGGGLSVIANAPNPAGYSILGRHFTGGISPLKLFFSAVIPTVICYLIFFFLGPLF